MTVTPLVDHPERIDIQRRHALYYPDEAALASSSATGERTDTQRLDVLQRLFAGADFAYETPGGKRAVLLIDIPPGVRVGAGIRAFADDARPHAPDAGGGA